MKYIRKINEAAWRDLPRYDSDSISDLATQNHELSVWEVEDNLNNLEESALAIALSKDKAEGILFAIIDVNEVKSKFNWDIPIESQPGLTAYTKLKDGHKNLMIKNLEEMGYLASHIYDLLSSCDTSSIRYIDEINLIKMIDEAVSKNDISIEDLNQKGKWKKALKNFQISKPK